MNAAAQALSAGTTYRVEPSVAFDIRDLRDAVETAQLADAVPLRLDDAQWRHIANCVMPFELKHGQVLIQQGARDQALYFVESGQLTVHMEDSKGRILLATVGPGSVVGEGAFFSHGPRSATAQAARDCRLWRMSPSRWAELSRQQPAISLQVVTALACVIARRVVHKARRVAVT